MSFLYRTELASVVHRSLNFSAKDITQVKGTQRNFKRPTIDEKILDSLEDVEDDEELERNRIFYEALMKNEVFYIQFKQKKSSAQFSPRRPTQKELKTINRKIYGVRKNKVLDENIDSADDEDDDGEENADDYYEDDDNTSRGAADTESNPLLRTGSFGDTAGSASLGDTTSSVASAAFNEFVRDELIAVHGADNVDEIDVRIAQLQHKRERQGKRRLRYEKQTNRAFSSAASSVRKNAAFEQLVSTECESRLDVIEVEEDWRFEREYLWEQDELTHMALLQIEEIKARRRIAEEEVDDCGEVASKGLVLIDVFQEDQVLRVCTSPSVPRSRSVLASKNHRQQQQVEVEAEVASSILMEALAKDAEEENYRQQQNVSHHPSNAGHADEAPDRKEEIPLLRPSSAMAANYLKREPHQVPIFQPFYPPKKPPPPPPPKSDDEIEREMKMRKERYARETLAKFEQIERDGILAHFMNDPLPVFSIRNNGKQKQPQEQHYEVGSIEERLANMHRMDMRAPTY